MADPFLPSVFDASNNSTTFDLFLKREMYRAYAFYNTKNLKEFVLPAPVRDFWNQEDILYGRVSPDMTPMMCSLNSLVLIEEGVAVVDFVADAYLEMKKEIEYCEAKGRFPVPTPALTNSKAVRGYMDPGRGYAGFQRAFRAHLIGGLSNNPDIISFKDFLPVFLQLIKESAVGTSFTRSSHILAGFSSLLTSGLAFEIGDYDAASDTEKIKDFIQSPAFEFYKNVAIKYGFYIDMNAPWRLVANLASPAMQKFMGARTGGSVGPITYFRSYAGPIFLQDIEDLQRLAVSTYNGMMTARPRIQKQVTRKGRIHRYTVYREPVRQDQVKEYFSHLHWLQFYIRLKNIEKGTKFSEARLDHIFNNSKNIVKTLDNVQGLRYINSKFDDLRFLNGSLNYDIYKRYYATLDKDRWPFKNFEEFYARVVSLATYKRY